MNIKWMSKEAADEPHWEMVGSGATWEPAPRDELLRVALGTADRMHSRSREGGMIVVDATGARDAASAPKSAMLSVCSQRGTMVVRLR